MQSIGAHEQRLAEEGKRLGDQQKAGALSRDDGIVILERMLDAYRPIDTRLHDIRPRPAALKDRQALLVQFVALRQEGIALLIEAERQQDEALAERGKERLNAGNALVAEMLKPFSWHD